MSDGLRRLVVAAVLAAAGTALADDGATTRPWSTLDTAGLVRAVQIAPAVVLADLQAERARLAAVAAGAFVGGSVRIGAETAWRSDAAGPSAPAGWQAGLGAISVSTSWYLDPSGPTHDAATRAVRGYEVALAAGLDTRRDAILDAFDRIAALERLYAQAALAAHRLDLARRSRDAVASQAEAGTASPAALAEADLAVAQADGDRVDAMADIAAAELAFERAVGTAAAALWAPADAPLLDLRDRAEAVTESGALVLDAAELGAAIAASASVAEATRAVDDAVGALERARRDAGLTVSLSARVAGGGDAGRWSAGATWDTRSRQPSVDLSIDPFDPAASPTTATFGANLSLPFGAATGAAVAQAEVEEALALARWQQAWASAALDLEGARRAADQADRALGLAHDRYALRAATLASVEARAGLGAASPLDLERARLDALEAALGALRAADQARSARIRLELLLGRAPSFEPIAAALGAGPSEVD